jgi:hypothetical protein
MAKKQKMAPHHWREAVLVHVTVGVALMATNGNWIIVEFMILTIM